MNKGLIITVSIIIAFMIIMIVIGKIASSKVKSSDDYLVANRNASLFLVIGTLFATFWGGGTIIGATGSAYKEGIFGVIEDPFSAGLSLMIIGIFFVKILRRLSLTSIGELYSFRFGKTVGYLTSALMIPTYIMWTAVQLLAVSKILYIMFGFSQILMFLLATVIIVIYTYLGGIIAVVWTDTIQMIVIFIGLIIIMTTGIKVAGGIEEIIQTTPTDYWNILPREFSFKQILIYISMWAGMALGNVPSPDIAQRAFIAKNEKVAKRGMMIAGTLYWTIGLIPVFIALIGITLVANGKIDGALLAMDSELLIPHLAKNLLSPVLLGVFLASLIAAILSSASTSLFATSVLIAKDVYQKVKIEKQQKISDRQLITATRLAIIGVGALAVIIGLFSDNIYDLTVFAFTLQFGVLFFPFVLALKAKFVTGKAIMAGMTVAVIINIIGVISSKSIIPDDYAFYTLVPPLANFLTIIIVSKFTSFTEEDNSLDDMYKNKH